MPYKGRQNYVCKTESYIMRVRRPLKNCLFYFFYGSYIHYIEYCNVLLYYYKCDIGIRNKIKIILKYFK